MDENIERNRNLDWYRRARPVEPPMRMEALKPDSIQEPKPRTLWEVLLSALAEMTPEQRMTEAVGWLQPQAKAVKLVPLVAGMTPFAVKVKILKDLQPLLKQYSRGGPFPRGGVISLKDAIKVKKPGLYREVADVQLKTPTTPGAVGEVDPDTLVMTLDPFDAVPLTLPHEAIHTLQHSRKNPELLQLSKREQQDLEEIRKYRGALWAWYRQNDPSLYSWFYVRDPFEIQAYDLEKGVSPVLDDLSSLVKDLLIRTEQSARNVDSYARQQYGQSAELADNFLDYLRQR